jgi:hypothetical protein
VLKPHRFAGGSLGAVDHSSGEEINRLLGGAVDVFLSEEEAREALACVLDDEPGWCNLLTIELVGSIELSLS